MTKKGKIIVIEGIDGSGKETQVKYLAQKFEQENIDYKVFSFPNYDSPSSSLIKMYLSGQLGKNPKDVDPYIASVFYTVDRYATFKLEIMDFYNKGGIVIFDRYTTSNMLHQASKIENDEEKDKYLDWLCEFEFVTFKLPTPDIVFFLNMPPFYGQRLIKNRNNKIDKSQNKDIHEMNNNYIEKSYKAGLYVCNKYNWHNIDCVKNGDIRSIEDINNEIFNIIKEYFNDMK